jgi:cation diffusion facilitator CzcD-associated flavoprotein CzcO
VSEHFDVLIVGAGLSGIGGAIICTKCPTELRHPRGPRLHRRDLGPVPLSASAPTATCSRSAIRSRSWTEPGDLDEPRILNYVRETAAERHRQEHPLAMRQARVVVDAGCWTVEAERTRQARAQPRSAAIPVHAGLYKYEEGYTPEFAGAAVSPAASSIRRNGPRIWTRRRVVVIGSARRR